MVYNRTANAVRRLRYPEKYKTIGFFCDMLGDLVSLNASANAMRSTIIREVCSIRSFHFSKDCACLIFNNPIYLSKDDYHERYAAKAKENGACVMISDRNIPGYPCIISDNPIAVYAKMCRYYRDLSPNIRVVAICGSIGKTTTKNMVAEVFKTKSRTAFTDSNFNTKESVGFAVQHLPPDAEYLVQEVHEGEPGETQFISEMLHPDILVLTPIDKSHLKYFDSPEKIVEEVCSMTRAMSNEGQVVVNSDDFERFDLLNGRKAVIVSTKNRCADYYADEITVEGCGIRFTVVEKSTHAQHQVRMDNIYAPHNVSCALLAYAAGRCAGIAPKDIVNGLSNFKTSGFRQNVLKINGAIVYADCYNAAELSVKSAIKTCDIMDISGGQRIAVLGDVEEAGDMSDEIHKSIAQFVNQSKFDILFVIGEKLKKGVSSIEVRSSLHVEYFDNLNILTNKVKLTVHSGDLVLFKASRASHLEDCIISVWPQLKNAIVSDNSSRWIRKSLKY